MFKDGSGRVGETRQTHRFQTAASSGLEGSIPSPGTKRCRVCKKWQPYHLYHKDRVLKDGTQTYRSDCKLCKADAQRRYYEQNREKMNAYGAEYRRKNREKILAQKRERYEALKADPVAWAAFMRYQAEWTRKDRERNPERYLEYSRRYRRRLARDPKRLAVMRQNRRMAYEARVRIRAEYGGYDEASFELVDAAPFKEWVEERRAAGVSIERLVAGSGVSERSVRRVLAGQEKVKLDLVDRVTMANDVMLWELYGD